MRLHSQTHASSVHACRSNTAKAAENRKIPFAYYYCDFSVGVFFSAAVAFVTLGAHQISGNGDDNAWDIHDKGTLYKLLAAVGAGAVFNVANLLLVRIRHQTHVTSNMK